MNRSRSNEYRRTKAIRAERRAKGICVEDGCGGFAVEGRTRCDYHLERNMESQIRYQKRREARKNLTPDQVDKILGINRRTA